ncbi:MAG: TIGR02281 family clan AA aspartic protease [Xanthobacteraceae bacterium]|jgi:aspartyl protease family protein
MRSIIITAIIVLAIAGVAPKFLDRAGAPVQPAAHAAVEASPPRVAAGPRSVVISPDARGHFRVDGEVDGRRLDFMVDTGATSIALRLRDAERLSIHPARRDYSVAVSTANGTVRAAQVTLDRVEVGGVTVRNVTALVVPDEALGENLLGLSFLSRLHRFEYREGRLVLEE